MNAESGLSSAFVVWPNVRAIKGPWWSIIRTFECYVQAQQPEEVETGKFQFKSRTISASAMSMQDRCGTLLEYCQLHSGAAREKIV